MSELFTLVGFVAHLHAIDRDMERLGPELFRHACEAVCAEAKRVLGTYDYDWPELTPQRSRSVSRKAFPRTSRCSALASNPPEATTIAQSEEKQRPAGMTGGLFLAGRSVGADAVARQPARELRGKYTSLINNFLCPKCAPVAMSQNRTDNSALTDVALG